MSFKGKLLIATLALLLPVPAATSGQRVGLVLSGGGAKGIAHIGVIRALEENGIPIDYITGTSMGAIVGGLYAAGYTPDEMMELLRSKEFADASTGTIDPTLTYLFYKPDPSPALININTGVHKPLHINTIFPSSLISPMPMNFAFMAIFSGYTAQCEGDFDRLFVPFRCVASDMTNKRKVVFSHGGLDDAIRASMSFPIVFKPIVIDGALLYDGGIYDNFPVDVMREDFKPDIMIGVDVHSTDTIKGFPDIMSQLNMLVTRPNDYSLPEDEGIKLHIDLNRFSLLDFESAQQIYEIGYEKANAMMDSIKSRVRSRRDPSEVIARRNAFKRSTPEVVFDSVKVNGGTEAERDYISSLFVPPHDNTFGLESARNAYTRAISTGQMKDIDPKAVYNPATGHFTLDTKISVKDNLNFGFGGYITSSANSMLFLSAGYNSMSFRSIDASVSGWLGQNYMAGSLNGRMMLRGRRQSALTFESVVWRQRFNENDKLFYQDESPAFITEFEVFTRLKYGFPTGLHGRIDFGVGYGHRDDRFYNNDETIVDARTRRNQTVRDLGQLMCRWEYNTLDKLWLPQKGRQIKVMIQGLAGHLDYEAGTIRQNDTAANDESGHCQWLQFETDYREYFPIAHKWAIGMESTLLYSTQHLMDSYNATIVNAPAFRPTASSYNLFNPQLRANSFITAGIVPIYKLNERISLRGSFHGFIPFRAICRETNGHAGYDRWFSRAAFFGEMSLVVNFPFASLNLYGNYQTSPGDKWGVGISFGIYILAPRFMRP